MFNHTHTDAQEFLGQLCFNHAHPMLLRLGMVPEGPMAFVEQAGAHVPADKKVAIGANELARTTLPNLAGAPP
jgi:hypothetical protein